MRRGVVHKHERRVPQKPLAHGHTTRVRGGVARAHELDTFERDPRLVLGAIKPILFGELAEEGDHLLRAVVVFGGEIDLVAEDDQPLPRGDRREGDAASLGVVVAVLVEDLEDEFR